MKKPFKQTFGMDEKEYDKKFGKKSQPTTTSKSSRKLTLLGKAFVAFLAVCGVSILGLSLYANALYNKINVPTTHVNPNQTSTDKAQVNNDAQPQSNTSDGHTPVAAGETCTTRTIYHGSVTKYVSYYNKGTQTVTPGLNGTEFSCSTKGGPKRITATVPAFDEIIYIGTYVTPLPVTVTPAPAPSTPVTPPRTYDQAVNFCRGQGVPSDSSAWQLCINAYLNQ